MISKNIFIFKLTFLLIFWITPSFSWAYPEMVRKGYVNCTSCHFSPSGGGIITKFGRTTSGYPLLSMAGSDKETRWAYFVDSPEWADLGGDYSVLPIYRNAPNFRDFRTIQMQADLEIALNYKSKVYLVGTAGYTEDPNSRFISRRFYIDYRLTDQLQFRTGKFLYTYGINIPNHTINVKRDLRINDVDTETYNIEAAWIGDYFNFYLTGIFGRPDYTELRLEKGRTLTSTVAISNTYKIGISYLHGITDKGSRDVFGPHAILGFTPQFYSLLELDFQRSNMNGTPTTWGFSEYAKLGYEVLTGFHVYLLQQLTHPDFTLLDALKKEYGLGFLFYPRPHFEFEGAWNIQITRGLPVYTDVAWLMLHYYL